MAGISKNGERNSAEGLPVWPLTTGLEWSDLVLDAATSAQVDDIVRWVRHGQTLLRDWGLARRLKPGFRCLFAGAPGTGKSLAAALIGKVTGRPVYRVALASLLSKSIGEMDKDLSALFEHDDWILFFDEAEALFGKRTGVTDSHDRAANQQTAYLLQRLEDFAGVAILASNLQSHLDETFARRFQAAIVFRLPDAEARLRLWQNAFAGMKLDGSIDFKQLAERHQIGGGEIAEVLRHACLRAVARNSAAVGADDIAAAAARVARHRMAET